VPLVEVVDNEEQDEQERVGQEQERLLQQLLQEVLLQQLLQELSLLLLILLVVVEVDLDDVSLCWW
jgi:hypothetical protein